MKKRATLIICLVCALLLFAACSPTIATSEGDASNPENLAYHKITAADGKKLLDDGDVLTLVDVRRIDEYGTAHIPGAINIPNESIQSTQPDELPDLNKTIVVYCRTGVRSKEAANKLIDMGYTDVRDMGGIVDWPYDTVTGTEPGKYVGNHAESKIESKIDNKTESKSESKPTSTGLMGNFKAKDSDGNNIDQSIFSDYDLTMVNVWATYCGPCLSEMPDLGELAREYDSRGVRIVGMVSDALNYDGTVNDKQLDTVRSIIASTGADYLHIIPSEDLFGLLSQISAVPTTFFVDSSGTQVGRAYLGSKSKAEWKTVISQTLEEIGK